MAEPELSHSERVLRLLRQEHKYMLELAEQFRRFHPERITPVRFGELQYALIGKFQCVAAICKLAADELESRGTNGEPTDQSEHRHNSWGTDTAHQESETATGTASNPSRPDTGRPA